jgi:hypothetical protein
VEDGASSFPAQADHDGYRDGCAAPLAVAVVHNWSVWGNTLTKARSQKAQTLVCIAANKGSMQAQAGMAHLWENQEVAMQVLCGTKVE